MSVPSEEARAALTFPGYLERAGSRLPVKLQKATRFSLRARFDSAQEHHLVDGASYDAVSVTVGNQEILMTGCRLDVSPDNQKNGDRSGQLVFLEDIYDFERMLEDGQLANIASSFGNLQLLLDQKQEIRQEFKDYTTDLVYDFGVHKQFFDNMDRQLVMEPEPVRTAGQRALIASEGRKFMDFFDASLKRLDQLVRDFSRDERQRHGFYFRKHVWQFILQSQILMRTNLKPRGYAGDSEMMRMCYENTYRGNFVFAQLMHYYGLQQPGAEAVRSRRRHMPTLIRDAISRSHSEAFRMLSVACGPAQEFADLLSQPERLPPLECVLLDQDPDALGEAKAGVAEALRQSEHRVQAEYLQESVRTVLRASDLLERWGRFDFVYSMGLLDYLTPPVARMVVTKLSQLLKPGGELVVGNFHLANPSRNFMEFWCDWVLYYRTEAEMLRLAQRVPNAEASVFTDDLKIQMFLRVTRPATPG